MEHLEAPDGAPACPLYQVGDASGTYIGKETPSFFHALKTFTPIMERSHLGSFKLDIAPGLTLSWEIWTEGPKVQTKQHLADHPSDQGFQH